MAMAMAMAMVSESESVLESESQLVSASVSVSVLELELESELESESESESELESELELESESDAASEWASARASVPGLESAWALGSKRSSAKARDLASAPDFVQATEQGPASARPAPGCPCPASHSGHCCRHHRHRRRRTERHWQSGWRNKGIG